MRQTARMIGRSHPTITAAARTTPCFGGFGSRVRTLVTRAMYEESDQVGNGGGYYEPSQGAASPKAFASFNVYKGKSALQLKLIGPTWKDTSKGGVYVDREGVLFMEFANSNPQQVRHARIFHNPCNMVAVVRIIVFCLRGCICVSRTNNPYRPLPPLPGRRRIREPLVQLGAQAHVRPQGGGAGQPSGRAAHEQRL